MASQLAFQDKRLNEELSNKSDHLSYVRSVQKRIGLFINIISQAQFRNFAANILLPAPFWTLKYVTLYNFISAVASQQQGP